MLYFRSMQRKVTSRRERPAKSALSRAAVVKAALGILKKEGLEKVTMRRIAAALETGAASLYVYVRDTRDLHAQLLDALVVDLPAPKPGPNWRRDLEQVVEALLAMLLRYPEIARLAMGPLGASFGPGSLRLLDTVAGLLLAGGADARAASWGVDLLLAYVVATAVEQAGRDEGGGTDLDDIRQLVESVDAATHPHLAKLGAELVSGVGMERFRWGLAALVNGILGNAR
jgi:AcrR family transcriptional regulator